ncbi:SAGA-associated factor 73 [Cryptococcus neoformans]|uniref:SAGA-associated factor 73 n=1 Tax=Cryptococcus neoformans Tu259-1 TaxID=1230072 RepID=A0A854Q8J5_CRYNE|nr:SAGA-associated factor 73 [Cryptococcus neoformans var. grubii AD1-83a]OWZ53063.1 SAGA-associated factor 73 [Cryptococcus neoformans var. grubii 125.91]OWZ61875.1 hypothetical protein AYX15_05920 [Cryptococcus neoformans var. grubii]OXG17771.1 SAGA-associated factor 73 [Cryptococcus neoformans var. grubii Tu259-1]OXG21474.1 SAGA-associated factor 73 [Cryptococcus neoformans var. grubii Ze90-1]OXG30076.1 SAGA-associated factor 73 [Cryptococcus neoformans var. grubii Bt15]OXG39259.1 SAGA-ass
MPLRLNPRSPLPPFSFSTSPSPAPSPYAQSQAGETPRPPADFLPEKDMHMFGTYPLLAGNEEGRGLVKCGRCGKVGMEWAAAEHRRVCNHVLDGAPLVTKKSAKIMDTKKRRASEDVSISPSKRARLPSPSSSGIPEEYKGLKKSEIKKLQKDKIRAEKREAKERERLEIAERKRQRANNPINYDRQCGVINDKGHPCARSLTCKTHTVGAKRAVQGRTRPYDELYLDWQREHNPNFKEPVKKDKVEKKKEKKKGDTEDDEVLAEGEEGRREISELIALTRMAGERCKHHISTLGHIPPQPTLTPGVPPPAAPPRPQQRPAKKPPFQPTWRSSSSANDFSDVGRMLVQALAARSRPAVGGLTVQVPVPGGGVVPGSSSAGVQGQAVKIPVS